MRLAALTVLATLALAVPAQATLKAESATSGPIRAELSYRTHSPFKLPTDLRLRVFDAGTLIVDRRISDKAKLQPSGLFLTTKFGLYAGSKSVFVRDLDGDGTPEALFDLLHRRAHCCQVSYLYRGTQEIRRNWGNPGFLIRNYGGGPPEFLTRDDAFSYRYGSWSTSLQPRKVLRLVGSKLIDVTRTERAVRPALRREAHLFRRRYRGHRTRYQRSSLAANAADQCLLGHCRRGYN